MIEDQQEEMEYQGQMEVMEDMGRLVILEIEELMGLQGSQEHLAVMVDQALMGYKVHRGQLGLME